MSDINNLKSQVDASARKVGTLGQEYVRAKNDPDARKSLVKLFSEMSVQSTLLAEQVAQLNRNMKGIK